MNQDVSPFIMNVEMDGWDELESSQVWSCSNRSALKVEADGQVNIWMICSSGLLHKGQLEESLCPRRFITLPVAISPPTNLEMNFKIPKVVDDRLIWRQSHATRVRRSSTSVSNTLERYAVKLKWVTA